MERSERETRHRRSRLSKSADFDRVYRRGRSIASRHLVLYAFPRDEQLTGASLERVALDPRLGVSVGRKVGGAVERNRVKRRIREAFWSLAGELPAGHDFVVVARPSVSSLLDGEGFEALRRNLAELAAQLGDARSSPPAQAA
jgi:ribonuclease P protein component